MTKGGFSLKVFLVLSLVFLVSTFTANAPAENPYPNRPITLIVGYGGGGGTDLTTRALADVAGSLLKQRIVVMNKPGGTSSVALSALKAEKPDGYTVGVMPSGGILASLLRKVPYDPIKDFTPIIQYEAYQDGLAVRSDSPWRTLKEFMDYAKNNPGKIRYASTGKGTPEALIMEKITIDYGMKWMHLPYDSDVTTAAPLLGGHVDAIAASSGSWKPHVESGKFRLLATFHEKWMSTYPDVPTFMECGYNMKAASLISLVGPHGMAELVVLKLHDAFRKGVEDPNFPALAEKFGLLVAGYVKIIEAIQMTAQALRESN